MGHVVDGHLRIELALARREPTVPVTYVELSEDEERLVLATLHPLATMAEAERDQPAALLAGLEPEDEALRALLDDLGPECWCANVPSPSTLTSPPRPSPSSLVVTPSQTLPTPSPTQLSAAEIDCPQVRFKTVYLGTSSCEEAIAAAFAVLRQGHQRVLRAAFAYLLPCPPNARCAAAIERIDRGRVVITSEAGGPELVSVVKAANGTITTTGPFPYPPSD